MIKVVFMSLLLAGCTYTKEGDATEKDIIWCIGACVSASSEKRDYDHEVVVDPNTIVINEKR